MGINSSTLDYKQIKDENKNKIYEEIKIKEIPFTTHEKELPDFQWLS